MNFSRDFILALKFLIMHAPGAGISGYALLLTVQIIFLIVYAVFVRYDDNLLPKNKEVIGEIEEELFEKKHVPSYPRKFFQTFFFVYH